MLILQQPHQLSYQPVPFVSRARKVISLLKKTLSLQSRRRWQQERQEPQIDHVKTQRKFPCVILSFDLKFQIQEGPQKFLKRSRWNKRDSLQKKTNTPYQCGFNCLRKFLSQGVLSSVKKDSSFSCPLIRIDRTGEGGINEGQRKDDLKLANVSTYWSMKFSKSRK